MRIFVLHMSRFLTILESVHVERVAEWLRSWTRDLGVWGSIHAVSVMCKSLGQALNTPPLSTQQEWVPGGTKIGTVWMATAAENELHSPQEDETVKK